MSSFIKLIPPSHNTFNDADYSATLRTFLYNLLVEYVFNNENTEILEHILNAENMLIWLKAFTHQSYDYDNNYENLEYIGDRVLHWAFPQYLFNKFPEYTEADYTGINTVYMSKINQGNISDKLKIPPLIRSSAVVNFNIKADVFESFIGALNETAATFSDGVGPIIVYNFISNYFEQNKIVIDDEKKYGAPKTQVQQFFNRFSVGEPVEVVHTVNGITTIKIYLTIRQVEFIQTAFPTVILGQLEHNIVIDKQAKDSVKKSLLQEAERSINMTPSLLGYLQELFNRVLTTKSAVLSEGLLIGSGQDSIKHTAKNKAYSNALLTLNHIGITQEWAKEYRRKFNFMEPELAKLLPAINAKNIQRNYKEIYFVIPRKLKNEESSYLLLMADDMHNTHHIIVTVFTSIKKTDYREEKLRAINYYLSS